MSTYYMSVCHDCKKSVMWLKTTKEHAQETHNRFHVGHNTEFGNDNDDEFYYGPYTDPEYEDLGLQDNTWNELASLEGDKQ